MSHWQLKTVPLKFQLGERTLWSAPITVHIRSFGLTEQPSPQWVEDPPADPPLGSTTGYMLRSMPSRTELPVLARKGEYLRYVTAQYGHCYIDLGVGIEAYRNKFSGKTRSTIQRKVRKFQEHCQGRLDWRCYRLPEEMPAFHRLARQVSARTYQERLLDAGIPADDAFLADMRARAAGEGVRAYLLFDGDRPVSYLYCPVVDGALVYAYLGYDPDYLKHSVGTVLQWLALEDLFSERRFRYFDFTEGQSEHKKLFATHERRSANILFLRSTLRNRMLVQGQLSCNRIVEFASGLAERWGIKARLRRWLRHGTASL
jgi:CelD/BcsL family acetyltransferase involved in cellulose biosynthesis